MNGVRARGGAILIDFYYKGKRFRETLRIPPTTRNLKFAERKREAILHEIELGQFDYVKHFPNSRQAQELARQQRGAPTIAEALDEVLNRSRRTCQPSTLKDYRSAVCCHLKPAFGHISIAELTTEDISHWISDLKLTRKRVANLLIPLRLALDDAVSEGHITSNPLQPLPKLRRFVNLSESSDENIDPFDLNEVKLILGATTGQIKNLFQFAFATGLRTSELIALKWSDVDLERQVVCVRRAFVAGKTKTTKTKAGKRDVILSSQAILALTAQTQFTSGKDQHVFLNPRTNRPWAGDGPIRKTAWKPALEKAGVRYRYPYQTRHTFASLALTSGEPEIWVAMQLGHEDVTMVRKSYGRWIPDVNQNVGKSIDRAWRSIQNDGPDL